MNTKKAEKALRELAKKEDISVEEVHHQIEIAITEARENPDPKIQAFWKAIPLKENIPRPKK